MKKLLSLTIGLFLTSTSFIFGQEPVNGTNLFGTNGSFEQTTDANVSFGGWRNRKANNWLCDVALNKDSKYVSDGIQSLHYKVTTKGTREIIDQVALGKKINASELNVTKDYKLEFDVFASKEITYEVAVVYHNTTEKKSYPVIIMKDQVLAPGVMTKIVVDAPLSTIGISAGDFKDLEIWVRLAKDSNIGTDIYFDNFWFYTGGVKTAVDELERASLNIYPNPTSEFFVLNSEDPIRKVEVFNVLGTKVKDVVNYLPNSRVDVANLPSGQYLVRVTTNKGTKVRSLMVK
ncbi:T9SS type A sorting domain-containing protein [Halosquirtibacter xylanolyticus]|uniref:T9SS type A sorting domain-containing protein n=1 Tax=Halosquirtibacter xylanolyticus TaxID=3374599 RepID=UPI003748600D|nr:T9SS type A sorting domain-containing protein [Prolixibacteraceae bacterium]